MNDPLAGVVMSLKDAAAHLGGEYRSQPYSVAPYDWIKQSRINPGAGHELAILNDVMCVDAFAICAPQKDLFVTDITYPSVFHNWGVPHKLEDGRMTLTSEKRVNVIEEPVFLIGGQNNHYHWLLNWLPRLQALDFFPDMIPENCKFVVHSGIIQPHLDSLKLIGITDDRIIEANTSAFNYNFKTIAVPSFYSSHVYYEDVIDFLRRKFSFIGQDDGRKAAKKAIYVSRQEVTARRRRVVNQDDLDGVLQKYGVETINCEKMTFEEQVFAFANADIVIGPHGAGLANIPFCKKGARVIIFEYKKVSEYEELANICGLVPLNVFTPQYVDEAYEVENPQFQTRLRDFVVDVDALDRTLSEITS